MKDKWDLWRERFAERRDAPPGGWVKYLGGHYSGADWSQRYGAYLLSSAWKQRRVGALRRCNNACQVCGSDRRLEVHHVTYHRVGREQVEDLRVLCRNCHQIRHSSTGLAPIPLDPESKQRKIERALRAVQSEVPRPTGIRRRPKSEVAL